MALKELVSILMSCPGISFKELKLIVVAECVIFPWSLIGATMQDGGKRERRNEFIRFHSLQFFDVIS